MKRQNSSGQGSACPRDRMMICNIMAQDRADVAELIFASLEMLDTYADRPFITMSMGSLGKITRAAGSFTGSCITFGMAGTGSAPGQIPAPQLRQMLKILA